MTPRIANPSGADTCWPARQPGASARVPPYGQNSWVRTPRASTAIQPSRVAREHLGTACCDCDMGSEQTRP